MYTGGVEVMYVTFDAVGSTRSTWFNQLKILQSTYSDIGSYTPQFPASYSLIGLVRFSLKEAHVNCETMTVW